MIETTVSRRGFVGAAGAAVAKVLCIDKCESYGIRSSKYGALDADRKPIPDLYVAGNTMGGRFLVDYPTVVQGISHSSCMTFGRLAGTSRAQA